MNHYFEEYKKWCEDPYFDEKTRRECLDLTDEEEIKERFYKNLSFGTGGLRGVLGAGTNRMNIYTVTLATQGLADYILEKGGQKKGVAIAFDSRNYSPEFSMAAALCLNANGIRTYRFETLRPTPELSFAVRRLGCMAGIVITASHNPPEYNGYKVYGEDGAQITEAAAGEILSKIQRIEDYSCIKSMDEKTAKEKDLFCSIGSEIDDAYLKELKQLILSHEAVRHMANSISIVYTPLNGAGNLLVRRILSELGFSHVHVVPEQEMPDGNFPTLSYPNPEEPDAYRLALALAKQVNAELVLATDPDADRLGIYVKDALTGSYIPFTGNMSGLLIAEYELSRKMELGILNTDKGALVKTIVSSNMANAMAREYGINLIEVLTGFKYIGEQIKLFEENRKAKLPGDYEFLFGFEESYGCLLGTHARDKDAVTAVMALCEAAAYYKEKGLTLWDQMLNIYKKYGFYREDLISMTYKGISQTGRIEQIVAALRKHPPLKLGSFSVIRIRDYKTSEILEVSTGITETIKLPKSNVLYYELEEEAWCCIRPSGTEPKMKLYFGVKGNDMQEAEDKLEELRKALLSFVK